jgi:hypothetical protein
MSPARMLLAVTRLLLGLGVFAAIGQQLEIHVRLEFSVVNFFSYFTNLSNLMGAGVFIATSLRELRGRAPSATLDLLRYMSAVNLFIVGVVFALLLRNVDLGALLPWINTLLHYVMPVAVLLDWMLARPVREFSMSHVIRIHAFPLAYVTYVLVRGASTGWYPYPFLNPANVGGYGGVAMYAIGIAVTFFLAASVLRAVPKRPLLAS